MSREKQSFWGAGSRLMHSAGVLVVAGSVAWGLGCERSDSSGGIEAKVTTAAQNSSSGAKKEEKAKEPAETQESKKVKPIEKRHPSSLQTRGRAAKTAAPPQQPTSPPADGAISFKEQNHDFGRAAFGESLKTKFVFTNTGTERLVIDRVRSSCGCTVPELSKKEYEPGESGEIDVTFKPKGVGRQTKSITVVSNARDTERVILTVSAETVDVVRTTPRLVQFGEVLRGTSRTVDLHVQSIDPDFEILDVEFKRPDAFLSAEIVKGAEVDESIRDAKMPGYGLIRVTANEGAPLGRMLRSLNVKALAKMDGEAEPKSRDIVVNCHATVVGDLKASPATLRISTVNKADEFKGSFVLTRRSEEPFEITKISVQKATIPGVEVRYEPWENNDGVKGYRVWVAGQDEDFKGVYRGHIAIETDVAGEEPLKVAFSGAVRAAPKRATEQKTPRR